MNPPPRIPPPPPAGGVRRARKRGDARWLLWTSALGVGVVLGVCAYRLLPPVVSFVDYWLAVVLG